MIASTVVVLATSFLGAPTTDFDVKAQIDGVSTMAAKVEALVELDNYLSIITERLDDIEYRQQAMRNDPPDIGWEQENTMHRPTLRDRRRVFRRAREDILTAMTDTYPTMGPLHPE